MWHSQLLQFFYRCDVNEDGHIDLIEFGQFMREEQSAMRQMFDSVDVDETGDWTAEDIRQAIVGSAAAGLSAQQVDEWVDTVVERISAEGGPVSWDHFRQYAMLSGARNLVHVVRPFHPWTTFDFVEDVWMEQGGSTLSHSQLLPSAITFTSGLVAGVVSRTCTAPMDRVKLAMQAQGTLGGLSSHARRMLAEGGLRSFWRGNAVNVVKMGPESAVKFSTYRAVNLALADTGLSPFVSNLICGAVAGIVSQTVIYPLEIVKTRMALANTGQYRSPWHCARLMVRHQGVASIANGWMPAVSGIIPYCAIEMAVFFTLTAEYEKRQHRRTPHHLLVAMAGLASVMGASLAYPFQLVRTKLQAQGMPGMTDTKAYYSFSGAIDCAAKTVAHTGVTGLYAGIVPNLLKSIPATCISYWTFSQARHALTDRFMAADDQPH